MSTACDDSLSPSLNFGAAADVTPSSPEVRVDRAGPILQYKSARGFEWTRLTLRVADLSPGLSGLRILHLSDLHARDWWDPAYDDLIDATRKRPPDLILCTGDFVDDKREHRPALPVVERLIHSLHSRLGVHGILGNHDGDLVASPLVKCRVNLLRQRRLTLKSDQGTVELIGLPGVARTDLDPGWASRLGPKPAGGLRIVMGHFPDLLEKTADLAPDVYLCGHTHGGQIAAPLGRLPLIRHDSLPRRLCTGIHHAFNTTMVTNRGFGFSSKLRLRLFCPAEVVEITVLRA